MAADLDLGKKTQKEVVKNSEEDEVDLKMLTEAAINKEVGEDEVDEVEVE
jgi:hypothetical protein